MILKYLLLFNFCLVTFGSFCQETTKGDIIKDRQFLIDKTEITAVDNLGNFVSIRPHRVNGTLRDYYIEFFDNLNFIDRVKIETQNNTDILNVFIVNGSAHILIKETENKSVSIRLDIIDLKTKVKSEKSIFNISKDDDPDMFKALENSYNISFDWSSEMVFSFPVINKKNNFILVKTFSRNLENLSDQIITIDKLEGYKRINFLNVKYVDNKLYSLFEINSSNNETFYKLIETNGPKERTLDIPTNGETYELINSVIKNNQLYISGLFSYQKEGGFDGFTYYRIDLNSLTLQSNKQSQFIDERARKYFNGFFKGNRNIDINNIFIDDDENTYLVGQFYELQRQYVPIGIVFAGIPIGIGVSYITINPMSVTYKTYDDLLLAKISPDGNLEWDNLLELKQTEETSSKSNKRDTSTFSFFSNNQINIFMNGFINMEKEKLVVRQNKRLSMTNFYNITVNSNGGITPSIIFPNEDSEILFRAESTVKSGEDIRILGQGNMRKQLLKIQL